MLQTLTYKLNVAPDGVPPMVRLSQNENGRTLQFELCGKGEVNIPNGSTVTISGTKPDGVVYSATGSLSGVIATFAEDVQMTAVAGEWDAKLRVIYNGETIATIKIWFAIDSDSVEPGAVPSESELNGLVAEAQQYAESARSAAYGSPLTASTAAAMTNTDKVYVYTGSETGYTYGHWYYYNGTTWADGGVYQSQGVQTDTTLTDAGVPADAKATGDAITDLREDLNNLNNAFDYADKSIATITANKAYFFTEKKAINTGANQTLVPFTDNETDCLKVECKAGDTFTIRGEGWASLALWAFYGAEESGTYPRLSISALNAKQDYTIITAPTNAKYLVMNVKRSPQTFYGFCCGGDYLQIRLSNLELPVPYERTEFFDRNHSDNLFNIDDYTVGRLQSDGTVDATSSTYFTTHYIDLYGITGTKLVPVIGSSTNIGASGWAAYDENKRYISGSDSSFSSPRTIPSGTRYIRVSYSLGGKYNFAVYFNDTGDGSANKIFYDNWQIDRDNVKLSNWYAGKKASAIGDSITANANMNAEGTHSAWRKFVANRMMLAEEIYNCGIGGSRVSGTADDAMWKDARINAIPTDSDVVLFNGGMNDWIANAPLGDEDSTDTTTFYGALNIIAEKLIARVPNALIFWMTTTFGMYPNKTNAGDLTTYDYGRAIKTVAEKYSFPCIDLHALCGWNQYNVSTFVNGETSGGNTVYIHPNENGGKKISTAICSVLESYQPF